MARQEPRPPAASASRVALVASPAPRYIEWLVPPHMWSTCSASWRRLAARVGRNHPTTLMKIVYLAAGAANMYCGTCLHDNTLATALRAAGEDVILAPTYTPLRTDEENVSGDRVFFGGINVYLQQKSALFRHSPWFLDAVLDSRPLMRWLSR